MNALIGVLSCVIVLTAAEPSGVWGGWGHGAWGGHHDNGQWHGEGLVASQDWHGRGGAWGRGAWGGGGWGHGGWAHGGPATIVGASGVVGPRGAVGPAGAVSGHGAVGPNGLGNAIGHAGGWGAGAWGAGAWGGHHDDGQWHGEGLLASQDWHARRYAHGAGVIGHGAVVGPAVAAVVGGHGLGHGVVGAGHGRWW